MNKLEGTTKEFWDEEYKTHRFIYGTSPSKSAMQCARLITEKLGDEGNSIALLEIGGGYGRNAGFLSGYGIETSVMDFSSEALKLGEEYANSKGHKVSFLEGDVRRLGKLLGPEKYDIVFSNFCLHIFPENEREQIYQGVKEVLKPEGIFAGSFLSINDQDYSDLEQISPRTRMVRGKPQHFFTIPEIKKELGKYLKIMSIKERNDPEKIIDLNRNTSYFFVVAKKKL